jgi:hypothetical protein
MKDDSWEVLPKTDPPRTPEPRVVFARKTRLAAAFVVAVVSDLLSAVVEFVPPLQWTLDLVTAALLFLILGRQWMILPGLVAEAIPGLAVLPFWVLVVGSIAVWGVIKPSGKQSPQP